MQQIYFGVKFRVITFKLQLILCHSPELMKAHIIGYSHGYSLNECIVMGYYNHLSIIINRHTYLPITIPTLMTDFLHTVIGQSKVIYKLYH